MEYFGIAGFLFGILAWFKAAGLSQEVEKLKTIAKEAGYVDKEKASLQEILQKSAGKIVKVEMSLDLMDYSLYKKPCVILDADDTWVKLRMDNKKQEEYLLRIDAIESVQFVES